MKPPLKIKAGETSSNRHIFFTEENKSGWKKMNDKMQIKLWLTEMHDKLIEIQLASVITLWRKKEKLQKSPQILCSREKRKKMRQRHNNKYQ